MTFVDKIIDLCPPDVFYNDLDKQAIALCLRITGNVRRFKDNPCVPQETRLTLEEHFCDLVNIFTGLPATQDILKAAHKNSHAYHFAIDVIRILLRHDLGESIFEPQSYLQKVDLRLPKIDAGYYEAFVARHLYNMAQRAVATGQEDLFITQISDLQSEYSQFDEESAKLTGQAYADYLYAAFDHTIERLKDIHDQFPVVTDTAMLNLMTDNNRQHEQDFQKMEDKAIQHNSPAGLFAKIVDTSQLEEIRYEVEKLQQPSLPYKSIIRQFSSYAIMVCKRSERFMPRFLELAKDTDYLKPFCLHAYDLTYTRAAAHALILRPYTFLKEQPEQEPTLFCNDNSHETFNRDMSQKIAGRRKNIHPLDDTEIMSGVEIAAKALTYRELKPALQQSMFDDPVPENDNFRALYDQTLAELQSDQTLEQRIARVKQVCKGRLDFYA